MTQGPVSLCCSQSCAWLCCTTLSSLTTYSHLCKSHSALMPAVWKSAHSLTSNASGVQVQHRNHLLFPPGHCPACKLEHWQLWRWWGFGAGCSAFASWGSRNISKCWWETWRSTWYGLFKLSLLPHCICSWVCGTSRFRRNFPATWWIVDWPFLSLVYEKNKETYLNSAGCP